MAANISSGDPGPSTMASRRLPIPPKQSQVDAEDLDEALVSMLGERVERSMANFRGATSYDLKPELGLVLKLVIFRFGIWDSLSQSSPGSRLQGLRIASATTSDSRPTKAKLLLYLLLHPPIFPSYILTRLRQHALSRQWPDLPPRDWRRRAWKVILALESFAKVWELAGWTAFLVDPRYPSLLMRMLKLRLVPTSSHLTRLVSYEFMNRQLVWTAFTEFLMFAIPRLPAVPRAIAPSTYLPTIQALLTRPKTVDYTSIPLLPSQMTKAGEKPSRDAHSGPFAELPLTSCPVCHRRRATIPVPIAGTESGASISLPPVDLDGGEDEERIFIPAQTDCWGGCRWCYYCIGTELARHAEIVAAVESEAGKKQQKGAKEGTPVQPPPKWDCLRCGGGVARAWRVGAEPDDLALTEPGAKAEAEVVKAT